MMNILPFLFNVSFLLSALAQGGEWQEYQSYEGQFAVSVPGQMKEVVQRVQTQLGELEYHVAVFRDNAKDAQNLMYMVSFVEYPEGSIHSDSTDLAAEFLDVTVEESALSVNGELMYQNDIRVQGQPGKLWRVDYGDGVIRSKAFVKGQRFYTIQTVCTQENSMNAASDQFLSSFRLEQVRKQPELKVNPR